MPLIYGLSTCTQRKGNFASLAQFFQLKKDFFYRITQSSVHHVLDTMHKQFEEKYLYYVDDIINCHVISIVIAQCVAHKL